MIDLSPLFGPQDATDGTIQMFRVFPRIGEERWMLDTGQRRPWHLRTWPRVNLRARAIYRAAWLLSALRLHLPSRLEQHIVAPGSVYGQLHKRFDRLGIFLGTPGPNRKFVVYAEREGHSVFIKIPLGPASAVLVARETAALADLATDPELARLVPRAQQIAGHLALENVETGGTRHAELDLQELLRIHELLWRRSASTRSLSLLRRTWQNEAPSGDMTSHEPETLVAIEAARQAADKILDAMPQDLDVQCYMAHGDFTRWNVLRTADGTAQIIDWELYGLKPRWFDVVHYVVSHDLLVARASATEVIAHLEKIGQMIGVAAPRQGWWRQVKFYFAYQCMYYCAVYERQANLHKQAIWQLTAWAEILHELHERSEAGAPAEAGRS